MADDQSVDIETLHNWLSLLDRDIELLSGSSENFGETIHPYELDGVSTVLGELFGWSTAYVGELPERLGVASPVLNQFLKARGEVRVSTARMVAGRLKSFVRSLESSASFPGAENVSTTIDPVRAPVHYSMKADQWVTVVASSEVKQKIIIVAEILDSIVMQVRTSNLPESEQVLSEIERRQLIAVLETTIQVLQAPMVEPGLLRRASEMLKSAAGKAVQNQVQEGLGTAARAAAEKLGQIIKDLL